MTDRRVVDDPGMLSPGLVAPPLTGDMAASGLVFPNVAAGIRYSTDEDGGCGERLDD
jgi:hypothetical protein